MKVSCSGRFGYLLRFELRKDFLNVFLRADNNLPDVIHYFFRNFRLRCSGAMARSQSHWST